MQGKSAQSNNIAAARAVADTVKSTLGPKGMDKMLVSGLGDVVITNDGATILREIDIEHPAAKMLIEVAKTQEEHCYDGTTSAVVLAGALLKESENLIEKNVHPSIIVAGLRMAANRALKVLDDCIIKDWSPENSAAFVAQTTLTGKSAESVREVIADIAVQALSSLGDNPNLDDINIICATGGTVSDSCLVDGIVLEKEKVHDAMPSLIEHARIALISCPIEVRKTEVDARIQITSPEQMSAFLDEEEKVLKEMVQVIIQTTANVVCCQKGIDDLAQHYLAKAGILAIQRCKKSTMTSLSRATQGEIVNTLDDLTKDSLGIALKVEEERIGEHMMISVTGCADPKSLSVILRGGTSHVVEEIERGFDDAIGVVSLVLKNPEIVSGGGSVHAVLAHDLRKYAESVGGRKQMAVQAFADALEVIPSTLAENAGIDPVDAIIALRRYHSGQPPNIHYGIYVDDEEGSKEIVKDMLLMKVVEPKRVVEQAIQSATDAAIMILRIDDVIQMKQAPAGPPM